MTKIRLLPIVAVFAIASLAGVKPAAAHLVEALTWIPAEQAADKETLQSAIQAAVEDVATHAVAFTPTMVSLQQAKLVGDRIYLFVLVADAAGEEEIEVLKAVSERPLPDAR